MSKKRYRAYDLGIEGVRTRKELIRWLKKRDGNKCGICGKPITQKEGRKGPSIDHEIPTSKGGQHIPSNIQLTHTICNNNKGDDLPCQLENT